IQRPTRARPQNHVVEAGLVCKSEVGWCVGAEYAQSGLPFVRLAILCRRGSPGRQGTQEGTSGKRQCGIGHGYIVIRPGPASTLAKNSGAEPPGIEAYFPNGLTASCAVRPRSVLVRIRVFGPALYVSTPRWLRLCRLHRDGAGALGLVPRD